MFFFKIRKRHYSLLYVIVYVISNQIHSYDCVLVAYDVTFRITNSESLRIV